MKKLSYGLMLALLLLSTSACTSSRAVREEVKPAAFEQALDGEHAYIHLHGGRMLTAETLYANPDSVHYARRRASADFRAVPTKDIAFINVTRPNDSQRVGANIMKGFGMGTAVGATFLGVVYLKARGTECSGDNCLGLAIAGGLAALSIPALGVLGGAVGGLVSIPRPRDTYYIQVENGRVLFIKQ